MEAIRQSMDVRAGNKPVKTSRLAYKLFGLPGVIAGKYYRRSRKRYRATVVSLFMSIVLFISASAFTDYLVKSSTGALSSEQFDLKYTTDLDTPDSKTPDERRILPAVHMPKVSFYKATYRVNM